MPADTLLDHALILLAEIRNEGIDMDLPCQCDAEDVIDDDGPDDWQAHRGDCPAYWRGRIDALLAAAATTTPETPT
jgi:hypothetical protein